MGACCTNTAADNEPVPISCVNPAVDIPIASPTPEAPTVHEEAIHVEVARINGDIVAAVTLHPNDLVWDMRCRINEAWGCSQYTFVAPGGAILSEDTTITSANLRTGDTVHIVSRDLGPRWRANLLAARMARARKFQHSAELRQLDSTVNTIVSL